MQSMCLTPFGTDSYKEAINTVWISGWEAQRGYLKIEKRQLTFGSASIQLPQSKFIKIQSNNVF